MQRSRRRFSLAALASGALAPLSSFAQQSQKVRRIGFLSAVSPQQAVPKAFPAYLQRLGYEEGKNLSIEWRFAEGKVERLPGLAQELTALNPELIVSQYNESTVALKQATRAIPIVMHNGFLPVENGLVRSLARPGENITGTTWIGSEQHGKYLEMIREAAPNAIHVANMWNGTTPGSDRAHLVTEAAAKKLGIRLLNLKVPRPDDVGPALEQIASARPDAFLLWGDPVTMSRADAIASFAIKQKLIAISSTSIFVESGLLLSYGPDFWAIVERTASYVDRILRGAKPGDLPVEEPAKFELVINGKTARAIGYAIPQSLSARVDRVVE